MSAVVTETTTPTAAPRAGTPRRKRRGVTRWIVLAVAVAFALLMLAPLLLLVLNAFKTGADYSAHGPLALPTHLSTEAFQQYLALVDYPRALVNSIVISGLVAVLGTALALVTSYALG
ncbi:MAG: carbohydrate ABC transporter permease, partial [Curtobacterium sp.]